MTRRLGGVQPVEARAADDKRPPWNCWVCGLGIPIPSGTFYSWPLTKIARWAWMRNRSYSLVCVDGLPRGGRRTGPGLRCGGAALRQHHQNHAIMDRAATAVGIRRWARRGLVPSPLEALIGPPAIAHPPLWLGECDGASVSPVEEQCPRFERCRERNRCVVRRSPRSCSQAKPRPSCPPGVSGSTAGRHGP